MELMNAIKGIKNTNSSKTEGKIREREVFLPSLKACFLQERRTEVINV